MKEQLDEKEEPLDRVLEKDLQLGVGYGCARRCGESNDDGDDRDAL